MLKYDVQATDSRGLIPNPMSAYMSAYISHDIGLVSGPGGLSSQLLSAAGRAVSHCPPRALRVVGSLVVDGVPRLARGVLFQDMLKDISSGQGGIRRDHRDEHGAARLFGTVQYLGRNPFIPYFHVARCATARHSPA